MLLAAAVKSVLSQCLSSHQLARDLDLNQKTALFMRERIRALMTAEKSELLQGIVEADETYIGGKRGRGTKKTLVIGAVECVVAQAADQPGGLKGRGIPTFLPEHVDANRSPLVADEYAAYDAANPIRRRAVVKHAERYASGHAHTNTIEGFWSLVKRAWYGSPRKCSRGRLPLFIAESVWKYDHRKDGNPFGSLVARVFA